MVWQEIHDSMVPFGNISSHVKLPFSHYYCAYVDIKGSTGVLVFIQVYPRTDQYVFRKFDISHHAATKHELPPFYQLKPHNIFSAKRRNRPQVKFDRCNDALDPLQLLPTEGSVEGTEYKQVDLVASFGDFKKNFVDYFWKLYRGRSQCEFWLLLLSQ